MFLNIAVAALQQGLCYGLVALGVFISYKILNFPDLSVDSTFPLGALVCVLCVNKLRINPAAAILIAGIAGAAAGSVTGLLHVKLGISDLLSGILVMTALLSVNLIASRLIDGSPKIIISYGKTIFGGIMPKIFPGSAYKFGVLALLLAILIIGKIAIDLFLKTKMGLTLRATGQNAQIVTSMGRNAGNYKIAGLAMANAMVSMGGAVYSQWTRYFDNQSGQGMVVIALASVIIGCAVFSALPIVKGTTAVIVGAVIYGICIYLAGFFFSSDYLKLIMATLFGIVLIINDRLKREKTQKKAEAKKNEISA